MMYRVSSRVAPWVALLLAGMLLGVTACEDATTPQTDDDQTDQAQTETAELGNASSTPGKTYQRKTLADGSEFHATNGIRVGPDGNLYVASVLSRSIGVVNPTNGKVIDRIGPERGVESPDDLAFGPDGSMYWTSFLTGEVGRLTPSGDKETVAQLQPGVNAIAFSPDGRLFVTRIFMGDELYELDPDGVEPPRLVASGLGGLNAMDFGPDGELYGPLWFNGSVARVDVETGAVTPVLSGLGVPAAVKFDSTGTLHVVDQERGEVIAHDLNTSTSNVVATVDQAGADNLAFDANDDIYLTNSHDGWVRKVLPNGKTRSLVDEGIVAPGGVAVIPYEGDDTVFIADALSMKGFDLQNGRQTAEVPAILGVSPLATPLSATNDNGRVLTTSWFADVVQVWDPAADTVVESHDDFDTPLNAVRYQGDLVVAELGKQRVVRRPADTVNTEPLASVPVPTGLATDGDSLWVADWATGRILRIAKGGEALETPELVTTDLAAPEGMT
ncbi:MAG: hypothetical protein ACOCV2_03695, partial [Persicimonas sp.]